MRKYSFFSTLLIAIILLSLFHSTVFASGEHEIINDETIEKIDDFKKEIGSITNIILAFVSITSVLIFIVHFIRLANSYDHPFLRRKVQSDLAVTAVVTALIGAIGIVAKIYIGIYM